MTQNKKLLTIGMPVYNEEKYIGEAIESLLAQTYKDFIFIISDNASTDYTPEICQYYAKKDKRIVFVRHTQNRGSFFNFKYLLDETKTPFFMWAGGHDKWHPQFIEKLLPIIQGEDLVLVYPQKREMDISGALGEICQEDDYTTTEIEKPINRYLYILKKIEGGSPIYGIWRTKILKNCYFKPVIALDILILLQASFLGKFKEYKEPLFFERVIREKDEKHPLMRQFRMITGNYKQKHINTFLLKNKFVLESIRILYHKNLQLGLLSKLNLSIQTIYVWLKKHYIRFFLVKVFKKILPPEIYFFFKRKLKKYL